MAAALSVLLMVHPRILSLLSITRLLRTESPCHVLDLTLNPAVHGAITKPLLQSDCDPAAVTDYRGPCCIPPPPLRVPRYCWDGLDIAVVSGNCGRDPRFLPRSAVHCLSVLSPRYQQFPAILPLVFAVFYYFRG